MKFVFVTIFKSKARIFCAGNIVNQLTMMTVLLKNITEKIASETGLCGEDAMNYALDSIKQGYKKLH